MTQKQGLSDLKNPSPTMSPGVELLTRDAKSCRGIGSSPMDTRPSAFHPRSRNLPVCSVGDTTKADMKSYGLAALEPLATTQPSPPPGGTDDPGVPGRGKKAIAMANVRSKSANLKRRTCLRGLTSSPNFYSSEVGNMLTSRLSAHTKKLRKKKFLQQQLKTAIRKSWS